MPDATTDVSGAFSLMDMCLYRDREILVTATDYVTQTLPAPFAAECDWSSRVELRVRMTRAQTMRSRRATITSPASLRSRRADRE